jgi:uncharacterized protein
VSGPQPEKKELELLCGGALPHRRSFLSRSFKGAHYRYFLFHPALSSKEELEPGLISSIIRRLRRELESYIRFYAEFAESLEPLQMLPEGPKGIPVSARRMHEAAIAAGTGPMAAVAGAFAELIVEEVLRKMGTLGLDPDRAEIIVENGGDISMLLRRPLSAALYAGSDNLLNDLAFLIDPADREPGRLRAVCSSSGKMGHSLSFGGCDLATVFAGSASLADAAATSLCNSVRRKPDIEKNLERIQKIEGIDGAVLVMGETFGSIGKIPQLLRHGDPDLRAKVSADPRSGFFSV